MCLGSTGSDTAGSIRIPSHCCGTTGIKPTYGRVSCYGVVPLSWSLDHAGPMTRSAHDAALMLNAMAGFDRRIRHASTVRRRIFPGLDAGIRGLRVGIPRTYFSDGPATGRRARLARRGQVLLGLGAYPVEVDFQKPARRRRGYRHDDFAHRNDHVSPGLVRPATGRLQRADTRALRVDQRTERDRLHPGPAGPRSVSGPTLWSAFDQADVLITPTMPMTATRIGGDGTAPGALGYSRSSRTRSISAACPCSRSRAASIGWGCRSGCSSRHRPWQEGLLLRVGHAYQIGDRLAPRRPPLDRA